jgi:LacI family transcriptional regulator
MRIDTLARQCRGPAATAHCARESRLRAARRLFFHVLVSQEPNAAPLPRSSRKSRRDRPFILFVSNATGFRVSRIMHGVAQACRKENLGLLWRDSEYCDLGSMSRRPMGVIVWDKLDSVKRLLAGGTGVPVVSTIGLTLDLPIATVAADPVNLAEQVASHLIEERLRNFVFVGPQNHPAARLRAAAFEDALRRHLGTVRLQRFSAEFDDQFWGADTDRGRAFIALLRKEPMPLGLYAFNDQIAASCMECAEVAGMLVPQQIAVVGVDNHPIYTKMYQPLSSVNIDYEAIGRTAVALIQQQQSKRARELREPQWHFVRGDLIVRQSSRPRLLGDEQISRALHYLHDHYRDAVTLRTLAGIAGMSRTTFALRFQRAVGQAPNHYLVEFRVNQAKLLLKETTLTVSEIAYQVGFNDPGYFARVFKKRCRSTAKEYRLRQAP